MNRDLPVDMIEEPSTELVPATERAALALQSSKTEQHLLTLAAKHASITEVKDKAGREQAHGAAMELTRARTTVEKAAKEARDDATKFSKAVIAEAARLVAIVEPEETRLKAVRDAWDAEQIRIKREAEEAERARVLALGARIQEIRSYVALANTCRGSNSLRSVVIKGLVAIDMTGFAEFEDEAKNVMAETLRQVHAVLESRLAAEAEAECLKAERAELARQQAEAKQKADELAAQQKAEADKLAAERAEFARQQQEAADKLAAQQVEIERQRAELEAAKAREQEEAAKVINPILAAAVIEQPFLDAAADAATTGMGIVSMSTESVDRIDPALVLSNKAESDRMAIEFISRIEALEDDGTRLTLGQINERLAPVSISVAGLAQLSFEPVAQVKASRFYRACDLPAMGQAIARHAVAATT